MYACECKEGGGGPDEREAQTVLHAAGTIKA